MKRADSQQNVVNSFKLSISMIVSKRERQLLSCKNIGVNVKDFGWPLSLPLKTPLLLVLTA